MVSRVSMYAKIILSSLILAKLTSQAEDVFVMCQLTENSLQ